MGDLALKMDKRERDQIENDFGKIEEMNVN
jgi:hypothetical protein